MAVTVPVRRMAVSTAGLTAGQYVGIVSELDGILTVRDSDGRDHVVLNGDLAPDETAPLSPEPVMVRVTITETVVYRSTVQLSELEEAAGVTLAECEGDIDILLQTAYDDGPMGFHEHMERNGDVQGQQWTGRVLA